MLGAWFAAKVPTYASVLDIGSGTGLLMLMIAQKTKGPIHGIELDLPCFKQLKENIRQSPWKERLSVSPGDVRSFIFRETYDFIITNPPFYENDLQSEISEDNIARHSKMLSLKELLEVIQDQLTPDGAFGILLPYSRHEYFTTLSEEHHFYPREKLFIRHTDTHQFSRAILHFSRHKENYIPGFEISIRKTNEDAYTEEFIDLLNDYYLYL
jgi:tRNA1Val (adenine37-N6)-methyltransferase